MRGMSGFGHHPGMRQLPRPGATGGSLEFVSMPGLPGRRSRAGSGHRGTDARACVGRGVRTAVPCFVTVREMAGRTTSPCGCTALRPAARSSQAPPKGATCGVQPHRVTGAAKCPCRRSADNIPGAPFRGACKAAAFSRRALQVRRLSVVTTTKLGSDDAARRYLYNPETRVVCGFSQPGAEEPKSAGKCQKAKRQFFRASAKKLYPDVRPCWQGGIGCPVSGARVHFVSGYAATLRLL